MHVLTLALVPRSRLVELMAQNKSLQSSWLFTQQTGGGKAFDSFSGERRQEHHFLTLETGLSVLGYFSIALLESLQASLFRCLSVPRERICVRDGTVRTAGGRRTSVQISLVGGCFVF